MSWTIGGDMRRSDASIHNLGKQIAHVLPDRQWRKVMPLFKDRAGDPFTVHHKVAGRMAAVLQVAAAHPKMPADWAQDARALAASAQTAARTRQPWKWS